MHPAHLLFGEPFCVTALALSTDAQACHLGVRSVPSCCNFHSIAALIGMNVKAQLSKFQQLITEGRLTEHQAA